jgi:uncharacterized protein YbjT (DUF2867 family)
MATHILVTGGTGTLGSLVVRRLHDAGHEVRVISRHSRQAADGMEFVAGDLATGEGIGRAVAGAEVIVHCAGTRTGDETKAANLVRAASRAGAQHLVYISVVGAPSGAASRTASWRGSRRLRGTESCCANCCVGSSCCPRDQTWA